MPILLPIVCSTLLIYALYPMQKWSFHRLVALAGALVWGGMAFMIALNLQTGLVAVTGLEIIDIRLGAAPLLEEILKASLLLLPLARGRLTSPAMGILYGFTIGLGFALGESLYIASLTPEMALTIGMTRLFSTHLMHGAGTALIGLALATGVRRLWVVALALAVGLHALFNTLNIYLDGSLRLIVLVGIGVACAFVIQMLINSRRLHSLNPAVVYAE